MRASIEDLCRELDEVAPWSGCYELLEEASRRLRELDRQLSLARKASEIHCDLVGSLYREIDELKEELKNGRSE